MTNRASVYEIGEGKRSAPALTAEAQGLLFHTVQAEIYGMTGLAALTAKLPVSEGMIALANANERRQRIDRLRSFCLHDFETASPPRQLTSLRRYFLNHLNRGDLFACHMINDVVLSSLLMALYARLAVGGGHEFDHVVRANLESERQLSHRQIARLAHQLARDQKRLTSTAKRIHFECMSSVSEFVSNKSLNGVTRNLAGSVYPIYLQMLEDVGIPSELSLSWMAALLQ